MSDRQKKIEVADPLLVPDYVSPQRTKAYKRNNKKPDWDYKCKDGKFFWEHAIGKKTGPKKKIERVKASIRRIKLQDDSYEKARNDTMLAEIASCENCQAKTICPYVEQYKKVGKGCKIRWEFFVKMLREGGFDEIRELEELYVKLASDVEILRMVNLAEGKIKDPYLLKAIDRIKSLLIETNKLKYGEKKLNVNVKTSFKDVMNLYNREKDDRLEVIEIVESTEGKSRKGSRRDKEVAESD